MDEKSAQKKFIFGGCQYERQSPPREKVSGGTKIINIELTLEEALKLRLLLRKPVER